MIPTTYLHSLSQRAMLLATLGLPLALVPGTGARASSLPLSTHRPLATVPVSGRVTQANGEGIPGVTIVVRGTNQGTNTDADGRFTINVPEGGTLVFSNVGYAKQEIAITGATSSLAVSLKEDQQALTEVVVVGYGTQERQSVTGAVASVSGRAIATQPVADAAQAIQGRAAGVQVVSNSGAPGGAGGTSIRVRGITSAGDNTPLYVVDGYPLPSGDDTTLNTISPNDIESIDILKDASATAIYGLRAANGVVIITTKRGKAGTSNVSFDGYVGQQQVWRKIPLLNASQFATLNNEARVNGGLTPIAKYANPASLGDGTNWLDQIFRRARIQNYSVSATGGSEKARYAVSAGYFQQDGTIINSNFSRFTLRANGDVALSKNFRIGNTLALTHLEEHQNNNNNNEFSGVIQLALQAPPTAPVYNADGSFYEFTSADNYGEENPVTAALRPQLKHTRNRATATFFAELEPVKGLRFRTNVGTDLIFDQADNFFPSIAGSSKYPASQASLTSSSNYNPSYLIENTVTYSHVFAEKHNLTVLLGQSAQQFNFSYLGGSRVGYSNNLAVLNQGPVNALISNYGDNGTNRLASYFARVNYDFAGKYLFSAIARYDGSSAFDINNKFGFFPGVSAGWRISEEDFLKDNTTVSNLKLRVGYGKVGNPNNAGTYQYLTTINSNNFLTNGVPGTAYVFGAANQNLNTGGAPTRLGSPNLRWENNEQTNVGIDLGLFHDRIQATVDLYTRKSPNLIASVPPATTSGTIENNIINAASSRNRGVDVAITTNNFVSSGNGFTWSTTFNFSLYRNQLVSLGEGTPPYFGQNTRGGGNIVRYAAGVPFGSFYGYVADGIIQTPDELARLNAGSTTGIYQTSGTAPGDIKFKDLNGDGKIDAADQAYIGNPNPDFTYGLNNTFTFKGFDLNLFLQGSQGNDVYNLNRYYTEGGLYGASNASTLTLDRWTGPGTSNYVPRAVAGDPNQNLRISSHYVENGSYMRIKLLTVGYTIPQSVFSKLPGVQRVRVYVSAQNLVTFTKYKGFDPELGNQGGSFGIDRGVYPQARVLLAGLNVGF